MFATIHYSYNYCSYAVWVLGSIGFACAIWIRRPKIPKIAASVLGFVLALFAAYSMSIFSFDLFVFNHVNAYTHFSSSYCEAWDYCYELPKTLIFDGLPLYYGYRFLSTTSRESMWFAVVPMVVAAFLAFEGWSTEFTRMVYPESIVALPLPHVLAAASFLIRGLRTSAPGNAI